MSGRLDGILTWADLSCAGFCGLRPAYVPQHGVQNRLMYLNLVLCTSTWGPKPPYVPQLGPMYLNMGSNTAFCTSTWPNVPQH